MKHEKMSFSKIFYLVIVAVFSVYVTIQVCFTRIGRKSIEENVDDNPLDGCQYVYLDMGTNIGVQIRKLFEPQHYEEAKILPVFEKYFGPFNQRDKSQVCAVGWEPNPTHTERLQNLSDAYNKCGFRTIIYTETGVDVRNSKIKYIARNDFVHEISGFLQENANQEEDDITRVSKKTDVNVIRIAEYIRDVVGKRKLTKNQKGAVVMKLDVEGREMGIMSDLIHSGSLQYIDYIHVDWPTHKNVQTSDGTEIVDTSHQKFKQAIEVMQNLIVSEEINLEKFTEITDLDDESYAFEIFGGPAPLPKC